MHQISAPAIHRLLESSATKVTDVYLALLTFGESDSAVVRFTVRALADRARCSERTVYAALAELEACSLIQRERRDPGPFGSTAVLCDLQRGLRDSRHACGQAEAAEEPTEGREAAPGDMEHDGVPDLHEVCLDPVPCPPKPIECDGLLVGESSVDDSAIPQMAASCGTSHPAESDGDRGCDLRSASSCAPPHDESSSTSQPTGAGRDATDMNRNVDAGVIGTESLSDDILQPIASCYRVIDEAEIAVVKDFVTRSLGGDLGRFRTSIKAIDCGVSEDSPLFFFLSARLSSRCAAIRHVREAVIRVEPASRQNSVAGLG